MLKQHDTTTKIQTDFHTEHMRHAFSPFVCLVSFCLRQHIHELHTTSRGSRLKGVAHVISSMHEVCGSPSTLISILFHFIIFQFILNLLHFLLHFFHYLEGSSNTAHSAQKGMDSLEDSYPLTGYMSPSPTTSRRLMSSPTQSP